MFDILMYLFEVYIHDDVDAIVDQNEITEELTRIGFHQDAIHKALEWIERLAVLQDGTGEDALDGSSQHSFRIYTPTEMRKFSTECRGFMLFLEQIDVLTLQTREIVIERVMELDSPSIELEDLKRVILMVLFNIPGSEQAYQQMEEILFDPNEICLH